MKKFYVLLTFNLCLILFSAANAQLYWNDSFGSYTSGSPLNGNGRWAVQESPTTGYMIQSASPLVYNNLMSDPNYAIGGNNYWSSGVSFPLEEGSALYTNHVSDANASLIGYKAGSSNVLWFSQLVRVDNNDYLITDFHGRGGSFAWWVDQWNLGIMRHASTHQWGIIINNDDRQFSNITTEVGEVTLIVAKFLFETDGITISLYVNPTPGVEPTSPAISGKSTVISGFCSVQQYLGFATDKYSLDEIRLGETYASVTPLDSSTKVAGISEKKPVVYVKQGQVFADLSSFEGRYAIQIYNLQGMLMKNDVVLGNKNVRVADLQKGSYLVRLSQGKENYTTKIIVK